MFQWQKLPLPRLSIAGLIHLNSLRVPRVHCLMMLLLIRRSCFPQIPSHRCPSRISSLLASQMNLSLLKLRLAVVGPLASVNKAANAKQKAKDKAAKTAVRAILPPSDANEKDKDPNNGPEALDANAAASLSNPDSEG